MNDCNRRLVKDRQLRFEDYLQMVSAEQREDAEVSVSLRIAENKGAITSLQEVELLERILHRDNLNSAFRKVKSNSPVKNAFLAQTT